MDFCSLCEATVLLDNLRVVTAVNSMQPQPLVQALIEAGLLEEFVPSISRSDFRRLALRLPQDLFNHLGAPALQVEDLKPADDMRTSNQVGAAGEVPGLSYDCTLDAFSAQIDEMVRYPSMQPDGPGDPVARAIRSNGYLLIATANGLDYFPDFDRAPFVASTLNAMYRSLPRQLYDNVAKALDLSQGSPEELLVEEWTLNVKVPIPPVAALVLGRARKLSEVPSRLLEIRDDFSRYREHFRKFRTEIRQAESLADRKKLIRKCIELLSLTAKSEQESVTVSEVLNFAEKLGKVAALPTAPTSYSAALITQPAEWVRRWWIRRPIAILFRLDSKMPKIQEYFGLIERLWGETVSDAVLDQYVAHARKLSNLMGPSARAA